MSKTGTSPTVNALLKLSTYSQSKQDLFLNPLASILKLISILRFYRLGPNDQIATGISNISDHINSSRYTLRFLLGFSSIGNILAQGMKPKSSDPYGKLRLLQQFLNVGYSFSEIPSYISLLSPQLLPNINGDALSRLSCQFWFLNCLIELSINLHRVFNTFLQQTPPTQSLSQRGNMKQKSFSQKLKAYASIMFKFLCRPFHDDGARNQALGFIAGLCDLTLALSLSLEPKKQFLAPVTGVLLTVISGCIAFYLNWKQTEVIFPDSDNDNDPSQDISLISESSPVDSEQKQ